MCCTEPEKWLPISGYEGLYEVSSRGSVRSLRSGLLLAPDVRRLGYRYVQLHPSSGKREARSIHRLVLTTFVGAPPEGRQCAHLDGDASHNCASNLVWKTCKDNRSDMRRHGTLPRGASHGMSKLTEACIQKIFVMKARGISAPEIAKAFSVTWKTVYEVLRRDTWKHVEVESCL